MPLSLSVIHAEWGRHWSGGTLQVVLLLEGLAQQGIDNCLVCPKDSAISQRVAAKVPVQTFPLRGEHDIPTWWRFAQWLRRFRRQHTASPLILHVHSRRGVLPTLLVGRWLRLPIVLHWRVAAPMPSVFRYLADAVIAVSQAAAQQAQRAGFPETRIHIIYSGTEAERFAPSPEAQGQARRELGADEASFVVAAAGRLVAGKGYDVLLKAVANLSPTERPILLLAGEGPQEAAMKELANSLGILSQVRFLGFQQDIRPILWAADVFVHVPTHFPEGVPNVILEAMAAGLPVIGSKVGGIPEIVCDGETGLLVPPDDPSALSEALKALRSDPRQRQQMGERAQARVRQYHDAHQIPLRVLAVYQQVLSGDKP